jgi:hypothetical protein
MWLDHPIFRFLLLFLFCSPTARVAIFTPSILFTASRPHIPKKSAKERDKKMG